MLRILLVVILIVSLPSKVIGQGSYPAQTNACEVDSDTLFVCGLTNPEDLYRVPNTDWVIASGRISDSEGPIYACLLYTSPSPRDRQKSRMPSSA